MKTIVLILVCSLTLSACRLVAKQASIVAEATPIATNIAPTATPITLPSTTPPSTAILAAAVVTSTCVVQATRFTYNVVSGDTLAKIAQSAQTTSDALSKLNCLSDPNLIQVGQTLYLPASPMLSATNTPIPISQNNAANALPPVPDATKCYYLGYGIGEPHTIFYTASGSRNAVVSAVPALQYFLVKNASAERYQIQYDAVNNRWGWVIKETGTLNGNCGLLTSGAIQTLSFADVTLDYPMVWFVTTNDEWRVPEAVVGTHLLTDTPPQATQWSPEMVVVVYNVLPDESPSNIKTLSDNALLNWQLCSGCAVLQAVTAVTTARGYAGYVFEMSAPEAGVKVYYLDINGRVVTFSIAGNRTLGDAVVNSARAS